jgi:hypothetical protein
VTSITTIIVIIIIIAMSQSLLVGLRPC